MRLTAFTDFGLRALMRLAREPDRTFTSEEIAQEYRISRNHLAKVVRELAQGGFVITQRGGNGGFRLARAPHAISIGDVVRHLEARHGLVECFESGGGDCALRDGCRLKSRLKRAVRAFLAELDTASLADCVAPPARFTSPPPVEVVAKAVRAKGRAR